LTGGEKNRCNASLNTFFSFPFDKPSFDLLLFLNES
jgi:hypothetical protein